MMAALTERDIKMLSQLSISHALDFRTHRDGGSAQNRLPAEPLPAYFNPPVTHGEFDFVQALKRIRAGVDKIAKAV